MNATIVKGIKETVPHKALDACVAFFGAAVSTGLHYKIVDLKTSLELLLLVASLVLVGLRIFYLVRNNGKGDTE